jgi:hypothetical protein
MKIAFSSTTGIVAGQVHHEDTKTAKRDVGGAPREARVFPCFVIFMSSW